jgi:hypothetical protein
MFDMWQKMVNPGAYPLQSLMFPVLDPKELEKKINELAVVEHWLKANVNMVQLTAKSLQFQLAMLKGGEAAAESMKHPEADAVAGKAADPAAWPWSFATPSAAAAPPQGAPSGKPRKAGRRKPAS